MSTMRIRRAEAAKADATWGPAAAPSRALAGSTAAVLLVVPLTLFSAACGGAAGGAPQEATSADTSAGGEAESEAMGQGGDYSPGAEDGGGMIVQPLGPDQQGVVDQYEEETLQLAGDFEAALELSTPDCGRAGEFRDAICDLATRICGIAAEHPEHEDVADKCDDGQNRCATARESVDDRCE